MRSTRCRDWVAFATAAVLFSCTLLNPLDYLQTGADPALAQDASTPDAAVGPEGDGQATSTCVPSRWSQCGVTVAAAPQKPGGVAFSNDGSLYFTDEAAGTIHKTKCTAAGCTQPSLVASGEDAPKQLVFMADSIFWTTRTNVRRLKVLLQPDASAAIETMDALAGAAEMIATYPRVVWTDNRSARGWSLNGSVVTLWNKAASSPAIGMDRIFFVSEGAIQSCAWTIAQGPSCPGATGIVPASAGAHIVAWAPLLVEFFVTRGIVAGFPNGAGSRVRLLDKTDDGGVPLWLTDEPTSVRSIGASDFYLYWTTAAGQLRRRSRDAAVITTVLEGLSGDSTIVVTNAVVAIADRGGKQVLTYVP